MIDERSSIWVGLCLALVLGMGCRHKPSTDGAPAAGLRSPLGEPAGPLAAQARAGSSLQDPPPHLDWSLRTLQWCSYRYLDEEHLLVLTCQALSGVETEDRDPGVDLPDLDRLRTDLAGFAPDEQACVLCQTLASCAATLKQDAFAPWYQAHHVALSALSMAGYVNPTDAPTSLRTRLPPEGGPPLRRMLATTCQACRSDPQVATEVQEQALQAACGRLHAAYRAALPRLMGGAATDCHREGDPPVIRNGIEILRPCPEEPPAWPEDELPPGPCDTLEVCALTFVQVRWPHGPDPVNPATYAIHRPAEVLEGLCSQDIDRAAAALDRWTDGSTPRPRFDPIAACSAGDPRLGPVLRRACAIHWRGR